MHETNDLTTRARALLDGITPGEWTLYARDIDHEKTFDDFLGFDIDGPPEAARGQFASRADAAFIAAAPDLVRDLLARVAQLELERDDLHTLASNVCNSALAEAWTDDLHVDTALLRAKLREMEATTDDD